MIAGRVEEANQITLNGNPDPAGGWRPLGEGPLQLSADAPFLIEHTLTQEDIDIFSVLATPNIRLVGDVGNATFIITELTVTGDRFHRATETGARLE